MQELELNLRFSLELFLDPKHEFGLSYLHIYPSNHVTTDYTTIVLDASEEQPSLVPGVRCWHFDRQVRFRLKFGDLARLKLTHEAPDAPVTLLSALLETSNFNVDIWTKIRSNYGESTSNKAGRFVVPLARLLGGSRRDNGTVLMTYVYAAQYREKGKFELCCTNATLAGRAIASLDNNDVQRICQNMKQNWRTHQRVLRRFIEAGNYLFDRIPLTWPSLDRINADVWVSRAGNLPAAAYVLDACQPQHSLEFYAKALDIILDRLSLTRQEYLNRKEDYRLQANVCGQVLCLFSMHCVYRSDIAYVVRENKKYEKGRASIQMSICFH